MKKQYIYSALILTALLTAGCAKEMGNTNTLESSDSAAIELSSVSTDPMTKAVITGTSFTTDEAIAGIGLSLLDKDGKAYGSNKPSVKYEFNSGKWTAASPLRVGNSKGYLFGYYPYSESITDITAIPVASSVNGTDWLYATPVEVATTNAKSINLALGHALARVSLSFKLDKSYMGDGSLSSISLSGDCVAASGKLAATDGSITATASKFTADTEQTLSKSTATTFECLVVPVSASGTPEFTVSCTIDGKFYSKTFTGDIATLTQGNQTTIEFTVLNTSIDVDGSSIGAWSEGGSRTVTVGGNHTVTVKLHKGTPASDVIVGTYLDKSGTAVVVKTCSEAGRKVICLLDDGNRIEPVIDGNYYKFILSDVTKDITATIRYESYKLKAFVYPSYSGTISKYETEHQPGDNITLEVTSSGKLGEGGIFVGWKDKDGNLISEQTSINFDIESDEFPVAYFDVNYGSDVLDGVFTVAADKGDGTPKKVRFSKGNLYCSGASFDDNCNCASVSDDHWLLEQHQYDCGGDWNGGTRISHFLWCKDCMRSLDKMIYDGTGASDQDIFFTNSASFAVNGVSAWHTLSQPEWAYLFGDSAERSGKNKTGVVVNGVAGLVIAPDTFSGTISNTYTAFEWATAEINDGLVFLPAAGFRYGDFGHASVYGVGNYGYYWSASPNSSNNAYDLNFNSENVFSNINDARSLAQSVRLVTEVK